MIGFWYMLYGKKLNVKMLRHQGEKIEEFGRYCYNGYLCFFCFMGYATWLEFSLTKRTWLEIFKPFSKFKYLCRQNNKGEIKSIKQKYRFGPMVGGENHKTYRIQ